MIRAGLAACSARLRVLLQYRAAALAGIATQAFFALVRIGLLEALYRTGGAAASMALEDARAYVWLSQAFLMLGMMGVDAEIAALVRTGGVAMDLARPVDLHAWWLSRVLAGRAAPTLLRAPLLLLLAVLLGQVGAAPDPPAAALALSSLVLALLLGTALYTLVTATLMWTIAGEGASRVIQALAYVSSGLVVPLPLLPDSWQPVLAALPFRGLLDVPVRIWIGHLHGPEAWGAVGMQAAWAIALVLVGRAVVARGVRRLVVQGG